jgi:hypothetical protein
MGIEYVNKVWRKYGETMLFKWKLSWVSIDIISPSLFVLLIFFYKDLEQYERVGQENISSHMK